MSVKWIGEDTPIWLNDELLDWHYYRCHRCCGIILSKDLEPIEYHKQERCRPGENMLIYLGDVNRLDKDFKS